MTAAERDLAHARRREAAERWRFDWRGLRGSFIIVTSRTWRAHHQPERCFEVYGLSLDDSRTHLVDSDFLRFRGSGRWRSSQRAQRQLLVSIHRGHHR
ncbi:hypothetical protein [Candidatus Amarobacter glycogenicus]|uniref:hypothetical protein n=1 Tax=Candidatus Amarobacter glycogenicus TaxID=3140699 RepID=UPI002A150857|nr:hypothetical protein [Dehalococcoidia bacterium]